MLDTLVDVFTWVKANGAEVMAIIWAIAKLTPSKADDRVIGKVQSLLNPNR